MRHLHKVLLLVLAFNFLGKSQCEEDVDELHRVKTTLRDCRNDLNNLEIAKDRCSEAQSELKLKVKELQNTIQDLNDHESLLLGAKEETDLVRRELLIAQDRLTVCMANSKAHESREAVCKQDLELARSELVAAAAREAEAEKALRLNDCSAARRDLRTYRDTAEQAAINAEALKKKIIELETVAASVPELESKLASAKKTSAKTEAELTKALAATQTVRGEMEAKTGALQAELDATKKALESLLISLDTRQKYEALLEEHRTEWLPHWLGEILHSLLTTVKALVTSAVATMSEVVAKTNYITNQIWDAYIMPIVPKIDSVLVNLPGWIDIRNALLQSLNYVLNLTSHIGRTLTRHVMHVEEASEGFALNKLQRVDSLKSVARHEVVHFIFWGAFASLVLPIALTVLKFIVANLIYFLLPGSASATGTDEAIEEVLGYKFTKTVGKKRLALLGSAVAQTLAAEKALKLSSSSSTGVGGDSQEENTLCTLMQQMIAMGVTSSSLANAADEIGLGAFIKTGPGARSFTKAQIKKAELYQACLGAVYVDSDFDITAARDVWNRKHGSGGKGNNAGGSSLKTKPVAAAPVEERTSGGGDSSSSDDNDVNVEES